MCIPSVCVRVCFCVGAKSNKDTGEPEEQVYMCVCNKFICARWGGLKVMPIQKGGCTHAQIPLDEPARTPIGPALLACGCMR